MSSAPNQRLPQSAPYQNPGHYVHTPAQPNVYSQPAVPVQQPAQCSAGVQQQRQSGLGQAHQQQDGQGIQRHLHSAGSGQSVVSNNVYSAGQLDIPVMSAPPTGATPFTPVYDYYMDSNGKPCKVLRVPEMKTEFRCSPTSGRVYTIQIPASPVAPASPEMKQYEWRCNPQTGDRYQIEVGTVLRTAAQPQQQQVTPDQHQGQEDSLREQLQDKVKGISKLIESGVTKKSNNPRYFAKKCPAKWAKKSDC